MPQTILLAALTIWVQYGELAIALQLPKKELNVKGKRKAMDIAGNMENDLL